MPLRKYLDIEIVPFLREQMESNTVHYQSDFEIDQKILARGAASDRPEDKTYLWLSRPCGTHCVKEHDAFIQQSPAHNTWRFYAEQTRDPIVAFAVEITGRKNGDLHGNVYELDYRAHAAEVIRKAVAPLEVEKIFEDGFSMRFPLETGMTGLREAAHEHGQIMDSLYVPRDQDALSLVLTEQTMQRDKMKLSQYLMPLQPLSLEAQTAYNAVKERHPDSIVCFAQHGYFEIYGEDAKVAAPMLGSKLMMKKLDSFGEVVVTGFKEEQWVAKAKQLWSQGNDVLLTRTSDDGKQETVKELKAADYIPVGLTMPMENRTVRIDGVNYAADFVMLTDLSVPKHPTHFTESIPYVRSFVEEADIPMSKADIDRALKDAKSADQPQKSVIAKLNECRKAVAMRDATAQAPARKPKTKEMEM